MVKFIDISHLYACNTYVSDVTVCIRLVCQYPENYPEVIPILSIEAVKGLSDGQIRELKSLADQTATENLGMPSIFTIAEALKEWLLDNNVEGQDGSMYGEMLRRMQEKEMKLKKQVEKAAVGAAADYELRIGTEELDREEEERLRRRQAGTQVSVDTFLGWTDRYILI